jgi:hypothetical protein
MKQRACKTILFMLFAAGAFAQQTHDSPSVAVPDQATAVKLAEKALSKIYGRKHIESERPFSAELTQGVWHVAGTLYCKDNRGNVTTGVCVGGVAMADIRQRDGRVMKTEHTM